MSRVAVVFPGQGLQRVGMGSRWFRRPVGSLAEVNGIFGVALGLDVIDVCLHGPDDTLNRTDVAQAAAFLVGMAAYGEFLELGGRADVFAGHSVGQLTALWAAEAMSTADAAELVSVRGRLMAPLVGGRMAVVRGVDHDLLAAYVADVRTRTLAIAVHNAADSFVISGAEDEVNSIVQMLSGLPKVVVSLMRGEYAFHSPCMSPAAVQWSKAVQRTAFATPSVPVVANTTALPLMDERQIAAELQRHLLAPVLWRQTMQTLKAAGVAAVVEAGSGHFLSALAHQAGLTAASFEQPRRVVDVVAAEDPKGNVMAPAQVVTHG